MAPAPTYATASDRARAEAFFKDRPDARATFGRVVAYMGTLGPMEMAATTSRVAFVAGTRFLWVHQAGRDGALTMGFLLPHRVPSPRLRSGAAGGRWSHHVKVTGLDADLKRWFREAYRWDRDAIRDAKPKMPAKKAAKTAANKAAKAAAVKGWTCPRCGQTYARRDQSHSCDRRAVEDLFADYPKAVKVTQLVQAHLDEVGGRAVRMAATKTQVSFAATRRFAWVWVPRQAVGAGKPDEPVVSFALRRRETDRRVKESVNPRRDLWMHHVVVPSGRKVDGQLKAWLAEAYETVGA